MSPTRSRALAPVLVVVALSSGVVAGCSINSGDKPSSQSTASTTPAPGSDTATPSESTSPTQTATTSTAPTTAPSPSLAPEAALLTGSEMPPLNDSSPWKERGTGPVGTRPFGLCQRFDVLSIGAEQAVERRFDSGSDSAAQEIATFPDAATAVRAQKVMQAWQRTCAKRVPASNVNVRPINSVPVSQGQGWWYLASYVQNGNGHFHTFGLVALGNRLSLLRMDHAGQDHNYPPGKDPMELAVAAAAKKLG